MLRAFCHPVATCCSMLRHVDCCWLKPQQNDRNISAQHIPTLLAPQHLQAPAKRSQHLNATDRGIVGRNMFHAFGHPTATCCDRLSSENWTSAHARAQHFCTNLAKWFNIFQHPQVVHEKILPETLRSFDWSLQRLVAIILLTWKICPFSNLSQQHPTCRNTPQKGDIVCYFESGRFCEQCFFLNVSFAYANEKTRWFRACTSS